jgi:hypothetical protein
MVIGRTAMTVVIATFESYVDVARTRVKRVPLVRKFTPTRSGR